jgi:hypothetical protein
MRGTRRRVGDDEEYGGVLVFSLTRMIGIWIGCVTDSVVLLFALC